MTESEKTSFKADFDLGEDASVDEVLAAVDDLPRYEAVRAFMRAGEATLLLLRDVFQVLESFGVATRTTGCIFVLANPANPEERTELAFSQRTVGAVCSWSPRKKWDRVSESLSELRSTWTRFRPAWQSLLRDAEPRRRRGQLDVVETVIRNEMTYGRDRYRIDDDARRVLRHFADRVEQMADRLNEIPDDKRPDEIKRILRDVRGLENAVGQRLDEPRGRSRSRQRQSQAPPDRRTIEQYTSRRFVSDFDKFLEDIYTLADLIRGEDVVDMLQIDVWSARPQLFEIWVLLKVLHWLRGRGYSVEVLKTEGIDEGSRFRWNLSYSKDSDGLPILLSELAEFHPPISQALVCIDFSGSFCSKRQDVLERLRERIKSEGRVCAPMCICFGGSATVVMGFDKWLNEDSSEMSPTGLESGTASSPLVDALSELKSEFSFSEVILVSDGQFDISLEGVTTRIEELGLIVDLVDA